MAFIEQANTKVASLASQGLFDPTSLTPDVVRAICATALPRVPDHRQNEIVQGRPLYEQIDMGLGNGSAKQFVRQGCLGHNALHPKLTASGPRSSAILVAKTPESATPQPRSPRNLVQPIQRAYRLDSQEADEPGPGGALLASPLAAVRVIVAIDGPLVPGSHRGRVRHPWQATASAPLGVRAEISRCRSLPSRGLRTPCRMRGEAQ